MNKKTVDQINGYSRLIVRELHDVIMDEEVYEKLKVVLLLSEELEQYMMNVAAEYHQEADRSNILQFKRLA